MSECTYFVSACFDVLGSHIPSVFYPFHWFIVIGVQLGWGCSQNKWGWGLETSLLGLVGNEDTWIPAALGLSETMQQGWELESSRKAIIVWQILCILQAWSCFKYSLWEFSSE